MNWIKKTITRKQASSFRFQTICKKDSTTLTSSVFGIWNICLPTTTSSAPPPQKPVETEAPSKWQHVLRHVFKAAITRWKSGGSRMGGENPGRVGGGDFMSQRTGGNAVKHGLALAGWFQRLFFLSKFFTLFFFWGGKWFPIWQTVSNG